MFGALVAGAEFENQFPAELVDTNHMSAIFGCTGGHLVEIPSSQESLVAEY